jgi:protein tyrosine phosphatase
MKKVATMTDKEWEDLEVASAQVLWENLNAEDEDNFDIDALARPDYGQAELREPLWSEVVEGLWQGGTADHDIHSQLKKPMITKKDFDTVITMYAYANPVDWFVREIRYGVWDSNMKDFDVEELFDIVRVAHSDWKKGKKVLIRCQAGWNRSGLITALVLIREGMEAQKAINLIRAKRSSHALCNSTFATWLLAQDPSDWKGNSYGTTRQVK